MSQVQQFYAGQNVFITGGTGFLGKILIDKLLRSCPDIGTIYLLIRAKKGKSAQERIDALFANSVFDVLRSDYPEFLKKIVGVPGDIIEERLGLSTADHARLVNEVSVIFHLAATIRFNEKLESAVAINVNSAKSVVDLAKACKNLKVGMYVSTAYSHCVRKSIKEELYPSPLSYEEVNKIVKDVDMTKWSEDEVKKLTDGVLGEWPNTYSFTKAIAEGVVAEFAKEMPFAVFRPSIVISSYREPIPGWLDGPIGLPGLVAGCGVGISHTGIMSGEARTDVVPVDYVCNALISSAWKTAITAKRPDEDIPVYNYVSGNENPLTWKQFLDNTKIFGDLYPTNSAVYYPSGFAVKSEPVFSVLEFLFHLIPALIIDSIARLLGKQPGLYKLMIKIGEATRAVGYFGTRQWDFENDRFQNLWKQMGPLDRIIFPFSMKNVDWDEHTLKMVQGIRKYILGDVESNLEQARRRHSYLYILHMIVRLVFGFLVLWTIWTIFYGQSPKINAETLAVQQFVNVAK